MDGNLISYIIPMNNFLELKLEKMRRSKEDFQKLLSDEFLFRFFPQSPREYLYSEDDYIFLLNLEEISGVEIVIICEVILQKEGDYFLHKSKFMDFITSHLDDLPLFTTTRAIVTKSYLTLRYMYEVLNFHLVLFDRFIGSGEVEYLQDHYLGNELDDILVLWVVGVFPNTKRIKPARRK